MKTLVLLLALALIACGSFKVREKNTEATGKIKKVAIVAFSMTQPAPKKLGIDLTKGSPAALSGGSMISEPSSRAEELYVEVQKQLKKKFNWEVINLSALKDHPGYKQAFDSTMKGWQNKMPASNEDGRHLLVDGIMDAQSPRILGLDGRNGLIQALKVDAIMVITVGVRLRKNSIAGIGNTYPQSHVGFQIYSQNIEKPVWYDYEVPGFESKTSVGKTAFFDEDLLNSISMESAKDAISKIVPSLN